MRVSRADGATHVRRWYAADPTAIVPRMLRSRLVLAAALLAGCAAGRGTAPVDPPGDPPPAVERREWRIENGFVGITLEIPREPPGPKPAVIAFLDGRERLHEAGWVTVQYQIHWETLSGLAPKQDAPAAPPAPAESPPAGSQPVPGVPAAGAAAAPPTPAPRMWGKWLLASPARETVGKGYFELIDLQASYVIPRVLDALAGVPEVDGSRLAVVGTSTTGFVALQAARDRRLRAAVSLVASGDYPCFLERSTLAMDGEPLVLDPAYRRFLLARDPARHPRRLVHAAVLMVNGREDAAIPYACAQVTAERFAAAFARAGVPERLRVVVQDGGHNLGPEASFEALAWLHRWIGRRR